MATACYNLTNNYLPASFKGVPFEAVDASSEHGRRGAEGEFPWGEETAYSDLGRSIRTYSITGRFRGDDHIERTEELIAAVESVGPGILVHPTRGILTVACKSIKVSDEIRTKAGLTTFDMEFVEANDIANGFSFGSLLSGFPISGFLDNVSANFNEFFDVNSVRIFNSSFVVGEIIDVISTISSQYKIATANVEKEDKYYIISDFNVLLNDLETIRSTEKLDRIIRNGLSYIDKDAATVSGKIRAFREVINRFSRPVTLLGETSVTLNALYSTVRLEAATFMSRALFQENFQSLNDALIQIDRVMSVFNEELEILRMFCDSPSLYIELRGFAIKTHKALLNFAYNAPTLVEYSFPSGVHSLVAAWEIFGDARRLKEIEVRNSGLPWALGPIIIAPKGGVNV